MSKKKLSQVQVEINYDENGSISSESSSVEFAPLEKRDELLEVKKATASETSRIRRWRFVVTVILVLTATGVTITTYRFLDREQDDNFKTAFDQFSRTVAEAAIRQQNSIRVGCRSLGDAVSASALITNETWPYVTMPFFESYAENFFDQTRAELAGIFNYVKHDERDKWIEYANAHWEEWYEEGHMFKHGNMDRLVTKEDYNPMVWKGTTDGIVPDDERDSYLVSWLSSPPPRNAGKPNWNIASIPIWSAVSEAAQLIRNVTVLTPVVGYAKAVASSFTPEEHDAMHSLLDIPGSEHPHSFVVHPITKVVGDPTSEVVAAIVGGVAWDASLSNLLPDGVNGIHVVVHNTCDQSYTYEINGKDALFRAKEDIHDGGYDNMVVHVSLALGSHPELSTTPGHCEYMLDIYPSDRFKDSYDANTPELFALVVACTFGLVAVVFFVYDVMVDRRNRKISEDAAKSNAIVTSLFPGELRNKVLDQTGKEAGSDGLQGFLESGGTDERPSSKPIADLFLETTVMFADIVGFTAWSSVRDPSQVFICLETLYNAFDDIAQLRRIFKVETVGDCYVAACGLPTPRRDHALAMGRFAQAILLSMEKKTKQLEVTLGPETGDLNLRIGLHSGPVTGGILRGERARFQLFGDTMDTTARVENTGTAGRIHVSKATADLISVAGKGSLLEKRHDVVTLKGKGLMETYWFNGRSKALSGHGSYSGGGSSAASHASFEDSTSKGGDDLMNPPLPGDSDEKTWRLVSWSVVVLLQIMKKIISRRDATRRDRIVDTPGKGPMISAMENFTPLEEVVEIITLPEFNSAVAGREQDPETVEVPEVVVAQLREFVTEISKMYRGNSFHSFEHASHVTMSVVKLLNRIVAPHDLETREEDEESEALHDHTYGITSDPLTQFACAFSALIHDVDHEGVPNAQLIKEKNPLATIYKARSVAEQNSLVLSMDLLMLDRFDALRECICATDSELKRFRQLVVNAVMATDIVDKDLKNLRNSRWDSAFKATAGQEKHARDSVNRKATIVIEHLIQASDVAHTMQHWHVYRKWNEKFLAECYEAYVVGRAEKDPFESWYEGEIGFFDFYIIPLAKKLKDCGVFGKSSDEYLLYAQANRAEWEAKGREVVAEMRKKMKPEGHIGVA